MKQFYCFCLLLLIFISCDNDYSTATVKNCTNDSLVFISNDNFYSSWYEYVSIDANGNYFTKMAPYSEFIFIGHKSSCVFTEDMPDYLEIRKLHDTLIYKGKETIYQLFDFTNPGKKKRKKCEGEWIYYIR